MSLSYTLPKHLTNGNLEDDGYSNDLFGFLCLMMATKVGDLKGDNKELFKKRVTEYEVVSKVNGQSTLPRAYKMADYLEGMNTNIQTESDAKWRKHRDTLLDEHARRVRNNVEATV